MSTQAIIDKVVNNIRARCVPFIGESITENTREYIRQEAIEVLKQYIPMGVRIEPDPNDPTAVIMYGPSLLNYISIAPQECESIYRADYEELDD